jgi:N6-L-threonylcarbamoyladenine synthase
LLVGSSFAKSLSLSLNIPLVEINHMHAHILSIFIEDNVDKPEFPFIALTVSGGHTQLVLVESPIKYTEIGTTLDDAAGEAFDKSGKILGLDYPAGPTIDKISKKGDPNRFVFTKPKVKGLNFSFSGLKTNFKNFINSKSEDFIKNNINHLCASLQHTIVEILIEKILNAQKIHVINDFVVCGGVSANSYLRQKLLDLKDSHDIKSYLPNVCYSTDNAAMIGVNAYYKYKHSIFGELSDQSISRYPV